MLVNPYTAGAAAGGYVWHKSTIYAGDPEDIEPRYDYHGNVEEKASEKEDKEVGNSEETDNLHNWGKPQTLTDHTERHGPDFDDNISESEYAEKANDFYNDRENYDVKVDKKGTIRVYDKSTNTFGSYNPDGSTRTFYKPKDGLEYWNRQPGK